MEPPAELGKGGGGKKGGKAERGEQTHLSYMEIHLTTVIVMLNLEDVDLKRVSEVRGQCAAIKPDQ